MEKKLSLPIKKKGRLEFEDQDKPLFMISSVAKMVEVHPQTLRLYERIGLIDPKRSQGRKRRYSMRNVEQLRYIQSLTRERGINLAGVKVILDLKDQMEELKREMRRILEGVKQRFYDDSNLIEETNRHSRSDGVQIKIEHD